MKPLRLGIIPLTDCAILAVAEQRGFFRRHGVEVVLSRETSWASLRDKIAAGALDGAQMLAGMPIAAALGIDPVACPLVTGLSLGLNGNAITVSTDLWAEMRVADPEALEMRPITARALLRVIERRRARGDRAIHLAMVYPFASHNYELRYWLAAAGIDPDEDVRLSVVPPPRMVDFLEGGAIDGFCVGEPWNSHAVRRGLGRIVVSKHDIWNNSPEKVFAVTRAFAEQEPQAHRATLRALMEAAVWSEAPENRGELASILSGEAFVGGSADLLAASLSFHVFHRYAATFPWISHAAWFVLQMLRWGQVSEAVDVLAVTREVYRPDLHREAAHDLGLATPATDLKTEGTHARPYLLAADDGTALEMGPDCFFDGRAFDPDHMVKYLAESQVHALRVSAEELSARNP